MRYKRSKLDIDLPYDVIEADDSGLKIIKKDKVVHFYEWGHITAVQVINYFSFETEPNVMTLKFLFFADEPMKITLRDHFWNNYRYVELMNEITKHVSIEYKVNYSFWFTVLFITLGGVYLVLAVVFGVIYP